MQSFCTIITPDFFPFAKSLFYSLKKFDNNVTLHVLVVNDKKEIEINENIFPGMKLHSVHEIISEPVVATIVKKYGFKADSVRWSMKPVFLLCLLKQYQQVIYLDCDIFFFENHNFLFKELENHSILLSPHWTAVDPFEDEVNFLMSFQIGMYNAGFIGASRKGISTLQWWAAACCYAIRKDDHNGLFDDQRYLDMVPIMDDQAKILRHRGCNLGSWNMNTCKRTPHGDRLLINDKYPIVFIHFNHETIRHILNGNDKFLCPYYNEFKKIFETTGNQLEMFIADLPAWGKAGFLMCLKRKTTIRTRFKKWLFSLSKKI